jgi:hypothetical protein
MFLPPDASMVKLETREATGGRPSPLGNVFGILGTLTDAAAHPTPFGFMFWLRRKKLAGSYSFFSVTSRPKFSP